MRLLKIDGNGGLSFTKDLVQDIPPYAILSHTWGPDEDEVTFNNFKDGSGNAKAGYGKIQFCAEQAQKDNLEYIWVDTCCIDKANHTELAEAITSMFRWYRDATKCYVYLEDVSSRKRLHEQTMPKWESAFQNSRWFTRGWTLQELLAPKSVNFFSREHDRLGDRNTLEQEIYETTGIPLAALRGAPLSNFSTEERMRWAARRMTKKREDKAYCLQGIFDVFIPLLYGEGDKAFLRLKDAINQSGKLPSPLNEILFLMSPSMPESPKKQLLESLNDGSPFTRSSNISKCSEGTFTWILDDQSSELRQWLEHGTGIFWLIGKPGSGKSTIVKFLAGISNQNRQTMQCLKPWARPRDPCVMSFYFWLADESGIQRSLRGFLCHLLHQLLVNRSPSFIASLPLVDPSLQKSRIADWDPEELETLLKDVACRVAAETPLCFFIDALDECAPTDIDRVIRVIGALALHPGSKIKFCVSSRPEQKLHNRLGGIASRTLELHKLTTPDIRRYVKDQFERSWQSDVPPTEVQKKNLVDELVSSSEGVFLWAFLVVRNLCEGMECGDSIDQLHEQLSELPHDMMELYERMLEKSEGNKRHRKAEAAMYFRFVLDHGERYIFHLYGRGQLYDQAVCRQGLTNLVPFYERYHGRTQSNDLQSTLDIIRQRVNFLCAGMVIAGEPDDPEIRFFHRTARDFFHEPSGKEILRHCELTQLESYCLFVDAVTRNGHGHCQYQMAAYEAGQMIRWVYEMKESNAAADKLQFLQHIDEAMQRAYATKYGVANGNWVYHQAKLDSGDDGVLDFVSYAFIAGSTELLSRCLSMKRSLSGRYKDYLLLCSSRARVAAAWAVRFVALGANPNASFYWGLQDRLKTSPWLCYLVSTGFMFNTDGGDEEDDEDLPNPDLTMDTVCAFLDNGASLDDRIILLKWIFPPTYDSYYDAFQSRALLSRSSESMYFVIEVNAKYLLEEHYRPGKVRFDARGTAVLSRPDVQKVQSHRKVVLVHYPGYLQGDLSPEVLSEDSEKSVHESALTGLEPGQNHSTGSSDDGAPSSLDPTPFAEIDFLDSEMLLEGLEFIPHRASYSKVPRDLPSRKEKEALHIWHRSPKVQDVKQYLEDKGYYKKADDPAVPQGPIPMFEDEE